MSESRCAHLISAHDLVSGWRLTPTYVALCGVLVRTSLSAGAGCPDECECEVVHCSACLRAAVECNRDADLDEVGPRREIRS